MFLIQGPTDELSISNNFSSSRLFVLNKFIKSSVTSSPASAYTSPVSILIISSAIYLPTSCCSSTLIVFKPLSVKILTFLGVIFSPELATTFPVLESIKSKLSLTPLYWFSIKSVVQLLDLNLYIWFS